MESKKEERRRSDPVYLILMVFIVVGALGIFWLLIKLWDSSELSYAAITMAGFAFLSYAAISLIRLNDRRKKK